MKSFVSELEDPIVVEDILNLEKKIFEFKNGKIDEEKFRSLRLARGIYGQRQEGVQMIRIKIPYGSLKFDQLLKICDVADEYSSGTLHATTRQDIQIHYVSLDRTPELWAKLESEKVTLREACGNTVRNVTASATAGIDPDEPFDVTPYAQAFFEYFLRNPICQEMGRKFKVSFSSSNTDTAFAYIHDIGFIPKIKNNKKGFAVFIGGGLGAQPNHAELAYDFMETNQIIPFAEALLRIFDRLGERKKRMKARFKFLLNDLGLPEILRLVEQEKISLKHNTFEIDQNKYGVKLVLPSLISNLPNVNIDENLYKKWLDTNVFEQKQTGYFGVFIKLPLGNMTTKTARKFVEIVKKYVADDIRITVNQGYLLRYVKQEHLKNLYYELGELNLNSPGFNSTIDVTACPGTDTCNLGISDSTHTALEIEKYLKTNFPELIFDKNLTIKISGCPNSCGQHGLASIGLHGSSQNINGKVMPFMQLALGGGTIGNGYGKLSEKVIKVPSKRILDVLKLLINDFHENSEENEYYYQYFERKTKNYFYLLIKPFAQIENVKDEEFLDWGSGEKFELHKAVGECAGVIIDLVSTLIFETEEKFDWALKSLEKKMYYNTIYHSYNVYVSGAKTLLLKKDINCNNSHSILAEFDNHFTEFDEFKLDGSFLKFVMEYNKNEPSEEFAKSYLLKAGTFLEKIKIKSLM